LKKLGLALLVIVLLALVAFFVPSWRHRSGSHSVSLSWQAPVATTPKVVGFNVYRSTSLGGPYVRVASGVSGLKYRDTAVNAGVSYYYVVRSVDSDGNESPASTEIKATVPD
jgi:fibronectin type 3 domain-containing protein